MIFGIIALVAVAAGAPIKLIIDTDAGFDVDDVGAMTVGNALQDMGEAEIIAISHTNGFVSGIGAVSTIMRFYDRDSVPLGSYKGPWAKDPNAGTGSADRYITDLTKNYPSSIKDSSQVPNATDAYRKVLADQPDHSVHIASIGITTNMRDLVQSKPDQYSPLDGQALIAQKVKLIVWMDGMYNFGCAEHDTHNWLGPDTGCRGSAQAAVSGWPSSVQQIFSGVGGDVIHGDWLTGCTAYGNPVRQAFEDWCGPHQGRSSWDPIAVMIAVRGAGGVHCKEVDQGGHMTLDEAGHESWHQGTGAMQSRIQYSGNNPQNAISFELNQLLCKPPGAWSVTHWTAAHGENCYENHGATDLDKLSTTVTLAECKKKCLELSGCTGVLVHPESDGNFTCYRKADVVLSGCEIGTDYSTYVRHNWILGGGFNCYGPRGGNPGHGATDMENPPDSDCGTMSVRDCQKKCESTPGCTAVTWLGKDHSGIGKCYRKSHIDLARCDHGTSYDTYLSNGTAFEIYRSKN